MIEPSERGITLAGDAALAWFLSRGVEPAPLAGPSPKIVAGFFRDHALTMTRIWHTPLVLSMPAKANESESVKLVLMLDGSLNISIDDEAVVVEKHESILLGEASSLTFSSDAPTARIELQFSSQSLHPYLASGRARGDVLERSGMSDVLAGLVTLIFAAGISPTDTGWSHTSRSVIEAISAMLAHSSRRTIAPLASSANSRLFHRAMDVIHDEYMRVEFSVEMLSQQLGTSPTRLREAFKTHGTTAREALRDSRVSHAARMLEIGNFTSREDLEHVARSAGFPSARTMTEAMRRSE